MNKFPHIKTLGGDDLLCEDYDLIISALGYESRALGVSKALSNSIHSRLALGFDHNHVLSYEDNKAWFEANGFKTILNLPPSNFAIVIQQELNSFLDTSKSRSSIARQIKIAIDISCFDRLRHAEIVYAIFNFRKAYKFISDFWYCIAQFEPPTAAVGRNEVVGPIHSKFAGRFTDPGKPLALIAGLGYEVGKVMGATEYLQASRVIALFPESPIEAYAQEVQQANHLLLSELPQRDIIKYPVHDSNRTIAILDSIVRGLAETHNIVMLPGGPKIFVLSCLFIQTIHPQTSVWRVSSGKSIKAKDVKASEFLCGLRLD